MRRAPYEGPLADAGVDDVLLDPRVGALEQISLLADALASTPEWASPERAPYDRKDTN